jgi:hypothetical protein
MAVVLIGIDDTDNDTSPGTGQLARRLSSEIQHRGAKPLGITRHQFLVDDRIPYTSHNSGACIAVDWEGDIGELNFAIELIRQWAADGSDPGICIIDQSVVPSDVMKWGWAATCEVLFKQAGIDLARSHGINLHPLGGTGDGIIGALASVGLRADGNEGRFLDLPGLRMLGDVVGIGELSEIGIQVEHHEPSCAGAADAVKVRDLTARYLTMNWVRPRLERGRPVWHVEWSEDEHAWIPVDRKRSRPPE